MHQSVDSSRTAAQGSRQSDTEPSREENRMDNAVAIVQAYLRLNGYFTVSEYPVVEQLRPGDIRTLTDLDILGFRFPGAGRLVARGRTSSDAHRFEPDPVLAAAAGRPDMLIGEVKEGKAELNRAARDPHVLEVVLARFGCCPAAEAREIVQRLIRAGSAPMPDGHTVRLVAFGAAPKAGEEKGYLVVPLAHCVAFLQQHLRDHWDVLRHVQPKDAAFGFLTLLEKARAAENDAAVHTS